MNSFAGNLDQLFQSIDDCISAKRTLPTLILIYAGIDVVAGLERNPNEGSKSSFVRWVDSYMLPTGRIPCTALELYAARCGIIHSLSAESGLSRSGHVRQLVYAWGSASAGQLQQASDRIGRSDIAIHVSELFLAFQDGVGVYCKEVESSTARLKMVAAGASLWLTEMSKETISEFLNLPQK